MTELVELYERDVIQSAKDNPPFGRGSPVEYRGRTAIVEGMRFSDYDMSWSYSINFNNGSVACNVLATYLRPAKVWKLRAV